jgi:hypothetical protein
VGMRSVQSVEGGRAEPGSSGVLVTAAAQAGNLAVRLVESE